MLPSVTHKTGVATESVEYPVDDEGRYAMSTGVLPASGCTFSAVSAGGVSQTESPFSQRPGCDLQLAIVYC